MSLYVLYMPSQCMYSELMWAWCWCPLSFREQSILGVSVQHNRQVFVFATPPAPTVHYDRRQEAYWSRQPPPQEKNRNTGPEQCEYWISAPNLFLSLTCLQVIPRGFVPASMTCHIKLAAFAELMCLHLFVNVNQIQTNQTAPLKSA